MSFRRLLVWSSGRDSDAPKSIAQNLLGWLLQGATCILILLIADTLRKLGHLDTPIRPWEFWNDAPCHEWLPPLGTAAILTLVLCAFVLAHDVRSGVMERWIEGCPRSSRGFDEPLAGAVSGLVEECTFRWAINYLGIVFLSLVVKVLPFPLRTNAQFWEHYIRGSRIGIPCADQLGSILVLAGSAVMTTSVFAILHRRYGLWRGTVFAALYGIGLHWIVLWYGMVPAICLHAFHNFAASCMNLAYVRLMQP